MITLQGIVKSFGAVPVIQGVSLAVNQGEFVSLLGPSGCGKTTLLRCIAGLESISAGEIRIAGKLVSGAGVHVPPEERGIGFIFQSYALWPHMTVAENIRYGLKLHRLPAEEIRQRTAEALQLVGLAGLERRYPAELSGGQQQRVAVARSVARRPQVLLFDEPLSNLDAALRERMRGELRELQQRLGTTAIYVTHDQAEALAISDRIVLMRDGHVVQVGDGPSLYTHPATSYAASFLGNINFLPGHLSGRDGSVAPGHLSGRDGSLAQVTLAGGWTLQCHLATDVAVGAPVLLGIRPEELEVTSAPGEPGANSARARIRRATYLGAQVQLELELPGLTLRAALPARLLAASPAAELTVCLPPERLLHIPTDDLGILGGRSLTA